MNVSLSTQVPTLYVLEEVDVVVLETKTSKAPLELACPATSVAKGNFIWSKYVTAEDTFIRTVKKDESSTGGILQEKKKPISKPCLVQACEE